MSNNVPDVGFKSVSGEKLQRSRMCLNSRHVKDGDFKFLGSLIVVTSGCRGRISFLSVKGFNSLNSCHVSVGMELGQVLNESQRKERFSHSRQQKRTHPQVLSWEINYLLLSSCSLLDVRGEKVTLGRGDHIKTGDEDASPEVLGRKKNGKPCRKYLHGFPWQ